jgi:hypothetical protein
VGEMDVNDLRDRSAVGEQVTDQQVWVNDDAHGSGYFCDALLIRF